MADKENLITQLRTRMQSVEPLADEPDFHTNSETVARYLKSRDWNLEEAERLLKETVDYRRQNRPLHLDCRWCHDRPGFHSMRQIGHDEMGRPVIYSNFSQATTHRNSVEDSISHVTYLIENAKLTMQPGISTWVFIIDCTGMTLQSCNPKLGYGVTQIMANHYPERLGLVMCLNHSPVFHGVWKAIKIFLHDNTVSKMKLVRSKRKILQTFQKYFSDEMTAWLLDEIRLNKVKPLPEGQMQFWCPPAEKGGHDPRGSPSYVSKFIDPYTSNTRDTARRIHKPHPNVLDNMNGTVLEVTISPEEAKERVQAQAVAEASNFDGSDDDTEVSSVHIADEFKIPQTALPLSTY
ncbi:SEC14-like protein 1 [Haliotis rufescens]|uniref:SEC14-like protein 1 n=1 Tax=Haliotis rufescens TaxID=6454 RepID=UPI001EB06CCE|nr:SEC14-like protein 1 [Haliotis rufescens]XP_046381987.1 SEC14-like protein 1 [Haliotis rufescens]